MTCESSGSARPHLTLQERVRETFGMRAQVTALAEEAAELSAACCRWLNDKGGDDDIIEEVVGVASVAESIRRDLGTRARWATIQEAQDLKLERTLQERGA